MTSKPNLGYEKIHSSENGVLYCEPYRFDILTLDARDVIEIR